MAGRFSSPELIAESSTNMMSRRKSFIFGPVTKWKRSWSTPIRQPRSVSDKGLPVEQPKQECPTKLPTSAKSTNSLPEGCAPSCLRLGYQSLLAVPLLFEQKIMGALTIYRRETGSFAPEIVNLLQTFATQSALAIQNARLFQEIEDKGRQLEAANRHKSEFLANVSHELRTPLNAIIGFSEVLGERMFGELNEKQAEYTEDILSSGRHLLSLINDILDLSKIEAGRMELEVTTFDLPMAIENALLLIRERASRHGIRLDRVIDDRLGDFTGDERKIKQILVNLLSNAVKFTPEGGQIKVEASLGDSAVIISVTDTGIGIAPEDHEAIFEEFRQVGTNYAQKREGTGLGIEPDQEIRRNARRQDLGGERVGQRINVYYLPADKIIISPAKARRRSDMTENDQLESLLSHVAIEVHRELGPGLLESVYEIVLAYELQQRGLRISRQVRVCRFNRNEMERGDRGAFGEDDLPVFTEEKVIVELKSR